MWWECDFWCGVGLVYLFTFAFIWVPGLLSIFAGYICGARMPRVGRPTGFRVGLWTGIAIVGALAVWTAVVAMLMEKYPYPPWGLIVSVYVAFHAVSILAPIIACVYVHTRRNKWWDLRPTKP